MNLRHLRYAVAVSEELHFTRAAERLGIGQPPLSQQIKQLEEEIGTPLFVRETRSVRVTEAGRAFVAHARVAIREAERAVQAARSAARGERGLIRIGFTGSATFNPHVPRLLGQFRDAYPEVELGLVEQATSQLLAHLEADQLDIVFVRPTSAERDALTTLALPAEPLWIALPSRHPLARHRCLPLGVLAEVPFVMYPRVNGSFLYDSVIAACRNAGFSPRIVQEAPQLSSTVNLVAAGVGATLVPESMCQLHAEGVVYVTIEGAMPTSSLYAAHRPGDERPLVHNFMAIVRGHVDATDPVKRNG